MTYTLEKDQLTFTYLRGSLDDPSIDNDYFECDQCHETVDNWSIQLHDCKSNNNGYDFSEEPN
jgi:hypothetical protein